MTRSRPATTGYERLAQADQFSDESDDDFLAYSTTSLQPASVTRHAPTSHPRAQSGLTSPKAASSSAAATRPNYRSRRRIRSNSGVDLKAINARLERWADEIASKFKRGKGKQSGEDEQLEIHYSVFQPPEGIRPATAETLAIPDPDCMARDEFEAVVDSVRTAIEQGVHPRMISQGSSGSYFARNAEGKVVGVFKPKDEEPYAAGNPKWNKWIHRNLFPCCFGRACLIPNLSYVSEAAAYVLDAQLRTHIVPYTDVVKLSSKSFHYPFWDRYNYSRKKKPLPAKPGSFQVFLKGFKDANLFLREHPWPDQYLSGFRTNDPHRKRRRRWADNCRPSSAQVDQDEESDDDHGSPQSSTPGPGNFVWTEPLKQSFREELEKLVILDYIMRNTDRGLDNWMIRVDWQTQQASIASEPLYLNMDEPFTELGPRPVDLPQRGPALPRSSYPYRTQKPMDASTPVPSTPGPRISVGAIDNSLSWPWKHPDAWRSFPFGWLFLPVDLIGRPFSQKTRDHFLPLLTSTRWWSQTQLALRRIFQVDPDFQERMFSRQIAVMKGQAWNVVETLKTPDHGPLELTRRAKVCVWDDLVDVPVAVPMRMASAEIRRHREASLSREGTIDEVDIGAHASSSAPVADLLGMASPPTELPHPGRFELADPTVAAATTPGADEASAMNATAPQSLDGDSPLRNSAVLNGGVSAVDADGTNNNGGSRREMGHHPALPRASLSQGAVPQARVRVSSPVQMIDRQGRPPFATSTTARRGSYSIAQNLYGDGSGRFSRDFGGGGDDGDELEGDLGYAAAEGMEGNQRKVIVERLEPVKSRNPVFTWC